MHDLLRLALPFALAAAALPAAAQYKFVGPDGRVTYTDRPPAEAQGRVTALGQRAPEAPAAPPLPAELREPVARFPATLYTPSGACAPCDGARQLLRARGVPYAERQLITDDDVQAFERLSGSREVPVLTLGGQTLRGFASAVWGSYLDAAGYPRESRLPAGYQSAAPQPLIDRRPVAAPAGAVAPPAPAESPAAIAPPPSTGVPLIRF